MPTDHIVALLIAERDKLNKAIEALSGNVAVKRRGRPPKKGMAIASEAAPENPATPEATGGEISGGDAPKKRKGFSAATKRKMALAQKKRWAEKKATEKEKPRGA